jgi:hypothetical protein
MLILMDAVAIAVAVGVGVGAGFAVGVDLLADFLLLPKLHCHSTVQ